MTPGGDRAIVVDSDYEQNKFIEQNPNSQQFFEQRQSVDAEEEDRSDAANAEVSVRRNSVVYPDRVTDHHAQSDSKLIGKRFRYLDSDTEGELPLANEFDAWNH